MATPFLVFIEISVWRAPRPHARRRPASRGCGTGDLERAGAYRVYEDPADLLRHLDEVVVR